MLDILFFFDRCSEIRKRDYNPRGTIDVLFWWSTLF